MDIISTISTAKSVIAHRNLARTIVVASFIIMTALGAYVRIPLGFTPVPITMQTFFVILCGAVLGRRFGSMAQLGYLALGALGMPIFQGYGAGLLHLAGPTGGYLVGFAVAAFLVGALIDKRRNSAGFSYIVFAMGLGLIAIYVCGIAWLMIGYKIGLAKALSLGFVPFLPGAAAKLIAASWIYSKIKFTTDEII